MLDIYSFEEVFSFNPNHSYSNAAVNQIQSNRKRLDVLFIDRLLQVLHVGDKQQDKEQQDQQQQQQQHENPIYPPHSNSDLRKLHKTIVSSVNADHHKQSLLFYLLKDCQTKPHDEHAHEFASGCYLPQKYWVCVEGLWEMDRLNFVAAMDFLTQPSLIPTFAEEILHVLLTKTDANVDNISNSGNSKDKDKDKPKATPQTDLSLPLAYYQSVSPGITSPAVRDAYFSYLVRLSVVEAYHFARSQGDRATHLHLLELLIAGTLTASPAGAERAAKGMELVDLPFDKEEEELFTAYLLSGKGKGLPGAKDTVMMRRIARGELDRALEVGGGGGGGLTGRKHDFVNWEAVREGIEKGMGGRRGVGGC